MSCYFSEAYEPTDLLRTWNVFFDINSAFILCFDAVGGETGPLRKWTYDI